MSSSLNSLAALPLVALVISLVVSARRCYLLCSFMSIFYHNGDVRFGRGVMCVVDVEGCGKENAFLWL